MTVFGLAILLAWLGPSPQLVEPVSQDETAKNVIVVCPLALQPGLSDWIEYRQDQAYEISLVEPAGTAEDTSKLIHELARENQAVALLLVGKPGTGPNSCPVCYVTADVNIAFGSTPTIPADNVFADFDHDGCPEIPVGRIPVDSVEMLRLVLNRGIQYETSAEFGDWRRRINLIAGVGGFDPVVDHVIEGATQGIIAQMMPEQYDVSMTWGSWMSPYCPAPSQFNQTVVDRFNEGCLFWVYIGHGFVDRLDRVKTPAGQHMILDNTTAPWLSAKTGSPIALMLCCFTCAFDVETDCLAQKMLEQPQGPVAVIGGTRMTMPYGMGRISIEMMEELFKGDCQTLGQLVHNSKRNSLLLQSDSDLQDCRQMVQAIATAFSPFPDKLDQELREHVAMLHLLGDPLLQIARPLSIPTEADSARAGETLMVRGEAPVGGQLTLEACYTRGRFWNRPGLRKLTDLTLDRSAWLQDDYDKCRDLVCSRKTVTVEPGPFSVELPIPEQAKGKAVIRTFIDGDSVHAAGSISIRIEKMVR